jgi:hypothetical protein
LPKLRQRLNASEAQARRRSPHGKPKSGTSAASTRASTGVRAHRGQSPSSGRALLRLTSMAARSPSRASPRRPAHRYSCSCRTSRNLRQVGRADRRRRPASRAASQTFAPGAPAVARGESGRSLVGYENPSRAPGRIGAGVAAVESASSGLGWREAASWSCLCCTCCSGVGLRLRCCGCARASSRNSRSWCFDTSWRSSAPGLPSAPERERPSVPCRGEPTPERQEPAVVLRSS